MFFLWINLWILILKCTLVDGFIMMCYAKTDHPAPEIIDPHLCTHLLIINNCTLGANGLIFPSTDVMKRYNKLKNINSNLKILLSFTPENKYMSAVAVNQTEIDFLALDVYNYLIENELDGFDFDWEFPVWSPGSKPTDKNGFTSILKTFRTVFNNGQRNLLLTAAVVSMYNIADVAYDANALEKYLDYVQIMNYDFHLYNPWFPFAGFNAPLHKEPYEIFLLSHINSEYSTRHWLDLGISPDKLVFGVPVYGIGFELLNKSMHYPYAPITGYSKYGGTITYRRACGYLKMKQFKYHWDKMAATPYLVNGKQWLSIEDKRSVQEKTQFARDLGLAGVMVFALDSDDYTGKCGDGSYPLTRAIKETAFNNTYKIEFVKFVDELDKFRFKRL